MREPLVNGRSQITGINVTPIIDVALVLVIILLITAPVLSISDLGVNLPSASTRGAEDEDRLSVTLASTGELSIEQTIVDRDDLVEAIRERLETGGAKTLVVIRADEKVPYRDVRSLLGMAREAGALRLAIATVQAGKGSEWTHTF